MLVLTRRQQESLFLGDQIKITVLGIRGQSVKVGIEAPRNIAVLREELYDSVSASAWCQTRKQKMNVMSNTQPLNSGDQDVPEK